MWKGQIEYFSQTRRVIAIDLRGFGQSGGGQEIVSMEQFADDCAAVLDVLKIDEPIIYIGLSMGGYIGWEFWRKYSSRIQALVMCDTRAAKDTAEAAEAREQTAKRVLREGTDFLAQAMTEEKLFSPETLRQQPAIVAAIADTIRATSPQSVAAALLGMARRQDATDWLANIQTPSLLVCGEHDGLTPPQEMRDIAAAMPRGEFVEIPNAGHMAPLEQPQAVNAAIERFLASVGEAPPKED